MKTIFLHHNIMSTFLKIILCILILIVLLFVAVIIQDVDPSQVPTVAQHSFADTLANRSYDLDSLRRLIGENKGLPPGFETAAAIAFSAYPELRDVEIKMLLANGGAPMESRPEISTLFGPRKNRRYVVLLSNERPSYYEPILLRSLPFDAQVGILAHELGHIVYYHQLNTLQIGKWGLNYLLDDEFRATHERTTDLTPIYHGLGSQIYQYAYFVRKDSTCIALYESGKDFMDKFYMTDEELIVAWKK
jgi:hypothetical protein